MSALKQHRHHPRTFRENRFVYPVLARRSRGLSIGVNLNPDPSGGRWIEPPLTDRYWYPVYEKLCELDVPATIHVSSFPPPRSRNIVSICAPIKFLHATPESFQ